MVSDEMFSMVDSPAIETYGTHEGIKKHKHVLAQRVGCHRSLVGYMTANFGTQGFELANHK